MVEAGALMILQWYLVLLLLPLPWLVRKLLPPARRDAGPPLQVPYYDRLTGLHQQQTARTVQQRPGWQALLILIWVLLVVAAARPTLMGDAVTINAKARDLMLAVDVSESMRVKDLKLGGEQVDRLTVVKSVLEEFIARREGDRLGLILFGSQAYLQTPLTFDHVTLRQLLVESQIGIAGPKTAIGDAIGLALKRLQDRPDDSKVLVLLTDGANTAGAIKPTQAAELAAAKGLKIYTIGVGSDSMVIPGILGTAVGSRRINPSSDLDEKTLKQIAELTGGRYFRAKTSESLRHIYELLDELEPVDANPEVFRPTRTLSHYPLALALLLSLLAVGAYLLRDRNKALPTTERGRS